MGSAKAQLQVVQHGANMCCKHALLHDHLKDQTTAKPALEGHVRREHLHDVDTLTLILAVQGISQSRVEGHAAAQDRKLETLSHLLLEEGICIGLQSENGRPDLLV